MTTSKSKKAKKPAAKKTPTKKAPTKKTPTKKPVVEKAKKPATKKPVAKKPVAKAEKTPSAPRPKNRRGDPDVVEKRRVARQFNLVFAGKDLRRTRRCERLLAKLGNVSALKPLELLKTIDALLESGHKLSDVRSAMGKRGAPWPERVTLNMLESLHANYGFLYETYLGAGFKADKLEQAGIAA
jgi:hypothetical protein